jgi:hypothetical protein
MEHVFVTGCPRSGTTALCRLLGSHLQVVLGIERYKSLVRTMRLHHTPGLITPELFEPDRFFDFRPSDTNVLPDEPSIAVHYDAARRRVDRGLATLFGDKVMPPDGWVLLDLVEQFPDARFVFVYRDPMAVANSFEVRARHRDDGWPVENDHSVAVGHWTRAFDAAEHLRQRVGPERIMTVRHELLFSPSDDTTFEALFAFLDLELWDGTRKAFASMRRGANRPSPWVLTKDQEAAARAEIDAELMATWDARATDAAAAVRS